MRFLRLIAALLLSIGLFANAPAQSSSQQKVETEEQKAARMAAEKKALALLDETVKAGQALRLPENRLLIELTAADLYWPHDPKRGRLLIRDVIASLDSVIQAAAENPDAESHNEEFRVRHLRQRLIHVLARRDPIMARKFMRENQLAENGEDVESKWTLALLMAENDPKLAIEIAREAMANSFSNNVVQIIEKSALKERDAALSFVREIVAKLRAAELLSDLSALSTASGLLQLGGSTSGKPGERALLDEPILREIAEIIASAALKPGVDLAPHAYLLASILPLIEKYAPARASLLQPKIPKSSKIERIELGPNLTPEGNLDVDALLEHALKAPGHLRPQFYEQAVWGAINDNDFDRALQITNQHITDATQRKNLLALIEKQSVISAALRGMTDDVRRKLQTVLKNEERATILSQLAIALAGKNEKKMAAEVLDEAWSLVSSRPQNAAQMIPQVTIADAYAVVEPERSFRILEPIVDQLDVVLTAGIQFLGFFVGHEFIKQDELVLDILFLLAGISAPSQADVLTPDIDFGLNVKRLGLADFDRTAALADRFRRAELRLVAQLVVAKAILSDQPQQVRTVRRVVPYSATIIVEEP